MDVAQKMQELRDSGVDLVRLTYSDVHGIYRGKDILIDTFEKVCHSGMNFAVANLIDGLNGDPVFAPGMPSSRGFPDMEVKPVLESLRILPWKSQTAWCLGHVQKGEDGQKFSTRCILERILQEYEKLGLTPIVAPELEFYLFKEGENGEIWRYLDRHAMVYTVGERADPEGIVREMLRAADKLELGVTAANHEFGRGQFEINLLHGPAMQVADRTFLFKAMCKEVAASKGYLATFMGKPLNDDEGTGVHLHISLVNEAGENVFNNPDAEDGISKVGKHFLAGILEHAPGSTAFLTPTINAYRRLAKGDLAPKFANWGYDNRLSFVRTPAERGMATRFELRLADGATNPYLLIAVNLLAGLDGMRRELLPPPPIHKADDLTSDSGKRLPRSLQASIDALREDDILIEGLGETFVNGYALLKEAEIARFNSFVTNWEINEYIWHL